MNSNTIPRDAFVLIIGAMKSGTSSLYSYMVHHPQICGCRTKEPEFFSRNKQNEFDAGSYEALWDFDANTHRYALEASTGYTKFPIRQHVPGKIHAYGIRPKFIYVLRNPFDRIVSQYNYMLYHRGFDRIGSLTSERLIAFSNYYLQLQQFRAFFPKEDFLLLDFEDIKHHPRDTLKKVYSFLHMENPVFPEDFRVHNKTKPLSRGSFVVASNPLLNKAASYLPKGLMKASRKLLRLSSEPAAKVVFSEEEKHVVQKALEAGMLDLHEEYGFDVAQWGF